MSHTKNTAKAFRPGPSSFGLERKLNRLQKLAFCCEYPVRFLKCYLDMEGFELVQFQCLHWNYWLAPIQYHLVLLLVIKFVLAGSFSNHFNYFCSVKTMATPLEFHLPCEKKS